MVSTFYIIKVKVGRVDAKLQHKSEMWYENENVLVLPCVCIHTGRAGSIVAITDHEMLMKVLAATKMQCGWVQVKFI